MVGLVDLTRQRSFGFSLNHSVTRIELSDDESGRHVVAEILNLSGASAMGFEVFGKCAQRRSVLVRSGKEHLGAGQIEECRDIAMALSAASLVDDDLPTSE